MTESQALTVQSSTTFLAPAASLAQLRDRYQIFNQFVKDTLRAGVDYQVIPGTDKPSLVKPGAEKLAALFGLSARFVSVTRIEDWTGEEHGGEPLFYYVYSCELSRGDLFVASCEGSCNSREKKYRYRNADRVCPTCGKPAIFKSKNKPEFYCWAKKGGCGATFPLNDKRITEQETGQVANPDIADVVNTIQKMAQKRAFVGAVLIATNASEYFTQDIEDMPGFVDAVFTDVPPEPHQPAPKQTPQPEKPPLRVDKPAPEAASVKSSNTTDAPAPSNGAPTNGNGHDAPVYTGKTCKIGKNSYPYEWGVAFADPKVGIFGRIQPPHVDGILQKLELDPRTRADVVRSILVAYEDAKDRGADPVAAANERIAIAAEGLDELG